MADNGSDRDPRAALGARLLAGAGNCPPSVEQLAAALVEVCTEPLTGDGVTSAGLADRVAVLARIRTTVDSELGRAVTAAEAHDVLPHSATTTLQRQGSWSGSGASSVITAARFVRRHDSLRQLWQLAHVSADVVAVLARGLRGLPANVEADIVAAVTPELPRLSVAAVRVVVMRALDLIRPADRDATEQRDWDRRCLVATRHGGMTMLTADLPGLEGEAVMSALNALAESLRVKGDGLTRGQRRADALITLVNRAAAHGDLPATSGGLPVATTVTVGISEADRVVAGQARPPVTDLMQQVRHGAEPAALTLGTGTGQPTTLGDAALRFALCAGTWTGVAIDDRDRPHLPIAAALTRTRIQPLAVGRSARLATPAQRTALALRDGGCLLCQAPAAECQTHHVTPWSSGGHTDLDNLALVCWSHHRQVDLNRWTIARNPDQGSGHPYWIVTAVPRHRWRRRQPPSRAA